MEFAHIRKHCPQSLHVWQVSSIEHLCFEQFLNFKHLGNGQIPAIAGIFHAIAPYDTLGDLNRQISTL